MFCFKFCNRTCIGRNTSLLGIYKLVPTLVRPFDVSISTIASTGPTYILLQIGLAELDKESGVLDC
jgi:hypothetical protein